MAVTEETPIASSVANGVTTVFPHTFTLLDEADLVVTGTTGGVTSTYVLGVDYTVSGVGTSSGSVTFGVAPASGVIVTRYRDIGLERTTDYQDNGDLLADAVNLDFDRLWFALQDIFNGGKVVPTCVRAPNGETLIALPAAASRAGYFLGFDGSGQPTLLAATAGTAAALSSDLATASDALKGDALVGVRNPATGGTARTQHQKNQDYLDVRDFGAVAGTDSTTAIQAAVDAAAAGSTIHIGEAYQVSEIVLTSKTDLRIEGKGSLTLTSGSASTAVCIRLAGTCDNIEIDGLTFIGIGTDADRGGIASGPTATTSDIKITRCKFRPSLNFGVYVAGYAGSSQYGGWRVTHNLFDELLGTTSGRGLGIVMESRPSSEEPLLVIIANNHFRKCQRHGVYGGAGNQTCLIVANNTFDRHRNGVSAVTRRSAIAFGRCKSALIIGNIFHRCEDGSVEVFYDTGLSVTGEGVLITGNKFLNRGNAWPDVTFGSADVPTSYDVFDVKLSGNQFIADQTTAGAQPFVDILNGRRLSVTDNDFQVSNAASGQYLVRLGSDAYISAAEDCDETAIENNRAWVQGASASSCRFLVVAGDICTNASKHVVQRNTLNGPNYIDYATNPPTNANLKTDAAGSYTGTLTGCTTSPTGTVEWSISDRVVTLEIPAITATSNTTAATITGMPVAARPASQQVGIGITQNNGVTGVARIAIGTDGVITLHVGTSATFTGSGGKGVEACSISYRLD